MRAAVLLVAATACGGHPQAPVTKPAGPTTPARPVIAGCPDGSIHVPQGSFTMGNVPPGPDVKPGLPVAHRVTLSGYCIDRTEVTVAAYRACVDAGACQMTEEDQHPNAPALRLCNATVPDRKDHPINCVSWTAANAFCAWRHARLPTEAEWERAARGTDGRLFPWGADAPSETRLNYRQVEMNTHQRGTVPVGQFPAGASPVGALDMAGNVEEWTADRPGYYGSDPQTNPRSEKGAYDGYMVRGGSWQAFEPDGVDSVHRIGVRTDDTLPYVGFRCARNE